MSEWISIKNRLPRNGEKVLAIINSVNNGITYHDYAEIATFYADEIGEEWRAENIYNENGLRKKVEVSYWMPIPSIPEEPEETIGKKKIPMKIKVPKPGKIYRHFKGGLYKVIAIAEHTETGRNMVIYEGIDNPELYVRPLSSWVQPVQIDRFVEVEE